MIFFYNSNPIRDLIAIIKDKIIEFLLRDNHFESIEEFLTKKEN